MSFSELSNFVETVIPGFGAVCKLNYANSIESSIDDVTLADSLSELSVRNPRVFGLIVDFATFHSCIKPDSVLY